MRVVVFSSKPYDRRFLGRGDAAGQHELTFFDERLGPRTATLADGAEAVCVFVNDVLDRKVLTRLGAAGVRLVALRCAGFNNVDLRAAGELGIRVVRVPAYSPHAVAEHTLALILALNRKIHRAYNRVREGNFALDGLLGFDLHGRTVGVVGTGQIGQVVCRILTGFGCRVTAHDLRHDPELERTGVAYRPLDELLAASDVVTLHCPLAPATHHLIDEAALTRMRPGVMLINTSRGGLVDTRAVIRALKRGSLGALGLDVYEEEADLFFQDLSGSVLQDDVFARLLTFPNVIITAHQAFFTEDALSAIAATTFANLDAFTAGSPLINEVTVDFLA
jgi:D-lactate dehydrogenase